MTATMLTAQQVQELLEVDASTIYRMAGDGRLPAVRIGRQWRFPVDAITQLLVPPSTTAPEQDPPPPSAEATGRRTAVGRAPTVPTAAATAALEALAPALGVTMVVTDLDGRPLTPIVHPAPAIAVRLDDLGFVATCAAEWRTFADEPHLAPRFQAGAFGFLCAHSLVRSGAQLVAMVLAGGVAADDDQAPGLFHLDVDRREAVLDALPRTAALLSVLAATSSDDA